MNIHQNANLTPPGRDRLVQRMLNGQSPGAAARAEGVCPRTARKWLARYKAEGAAGLQDRSSRPKKLRKPTPTKIVNRIIALRRQRWTGKHIAREAGVSPATVSRVLTRAGLSRLKDLAPAEPVQPVRTQDARRDHPSGHKKAWPVRTYRPPHHRRPNPPVKSARPERRRLWLGICARGDR